MNSPRSPLDSEWLSAAPELETPQHRMIREYPIGVKINLPVVIRMTVWTDRQHWTRQVKFQDLYIFSPKAMPMVVTVCTI